jgi:hypothetical protein
LKSTLLKRTPFVQKEPAPRKLKPKKCRICAAEYQPISSTSKVCSGACALKLIQKQAAVQKTRQRRQERAQDREKREAMKTYPQLIAEAQREFNAFIRLRDAAQPCICCGRTSEKTFITGSDWDAGHYRSTGSAPHLRFHEDNVHRQLVACNRFGAGRAVDYRLGLIARIGLARVEALEADNTPRKWTHDELRELKAHYKAKLAALKKERA